MFQRYGLYVCGVNSSKLYLFVGLLCLFVSLFCPYVCGANSGKLCAFFLFPFCLFLTVWLAAWICVCTIYVYAQKYLFVGLFCLFLGLFCLNVSVRHTHTHTNTHTQTHTHTHTRRWEVPFVLERLAQWLHLLSLGFSLEFSLGFLAPLEGLGLFTSL